MVEKKRRSAIGTKSKPAGKPAAKPDESRSTDEKPVPKGHVGTPSRKARGK
jgi:hypothetical protein